MYISVHKKNPIKIGEGKNEYVLTHTWISGGKIQYILIFPGGGGGGGGNIGEYGGKMSM